MAETLNALLDQPVLLLVILTVGAVIGIAVERLVTAQDRARKRAYWQGRNAEKGKTAKIVPLAPEKPDGKDFAADQLKLVMKAEFRRRALLNRAEGNVFRALDKIVIARNGREALNRLAAKPRPDLVLMDIMMPEMDGIEAMQEIRKKPELRDLPIIALTAKAMPDDQQRCLAAGANDYITKPIDVDKLTSLIRIWMPK